jgi:hypothetical protein
MLKGIWPRNARKLQFKPAQDLKKQKGSTMQAPTPLHLRTFNKLRVMHKLQQTKAHSLAHSMMAIIMQTPIKEMRNSLVTKAGHKIGAYHLESMLNGHTRMGESPLLDPHPSHQGQGSTKGPSLHRTRSPLRQPTLRASRLAILKDLLVVFQTVLEKQEGTGLYQQIPPLQTVLHLKMNKLTRMNSSLVKG